MLPVKIKDFRPEHTATNAENTCDHFDFGFVCVDFLKPQRSILMLAFERIFFVIRVVHNNQMIKAASPTANGVSVEKTVPATAVKLLPLVV